MVNDSQSKIKYIHMEELLKEELLSGKFKKGDLFYTEKELIEKYKISYATVSRTMKNMTEKGFFERHRGLGTVICQIPSLSKDLLALQTLYFNGISSITEHRSKIPFSWFVEEGIQRGVINAWPGKVKITDMSEIIEMASSGEKINVIFLSPWKEFEKEIENMKGLYSIINLARYFSLPYNSVMPDFLLGVYNMVSYLIRELGHKKIAFIGGETSNYHADRFAGYKLALESHFIDFRKDYCVRGIEYPQTGDPDISIARKDAYDAMKKILKLKDPPTAVFADTDLKAFGAVKAIQDAGLRVPEDISVAGFDNIPWTDENPVKLTTVNLPLSRLGEKAVDMLIERILNKGKNISSSTVYGEIIVRNSCAPLKQEGKS